MKVKRVNELKIVRDCQFEIDDKEVVVSFSATARKGAMAAEVWSYNIVSDLKDIWNSLDGPKNYFMLNENTAIAAIFALREYDYIHIDIISIKVLPNIISFDDYQIAHHSEINFNRRVKVVRIKRIENNDLQGGIVVKKRDKKLIMPFYCPEALEKGIRKELRVVLVRDLAYVESIEPGDNEMRFIDLEKFQKDQTIEYILPAVRSEMTAGQKMKRLRMERKAMGFCPYCGKEELQPDETRCESCCTKQSKREKRNYEKAKKSGICTQRGCNKKTQDGHVLCNKHLEESRERNKRRYHEDKKSNICVVSGCHEKSERGQLKCATHLGWLQQKTGS